MSEGPKYHWPGVNQSSPDHPMAVRLSDGTEFTGTDTEVISALLVRSIEQTIELTNQQKITNQHLSYINDGLTFTERDIRNVT